MIVRDILVFVLEFIPRLEFQQIAISATLYPGHVVAVLLRRQKQLPTIFET